MTIEEFLWRTFDSKFAKKLNKLPKSEQKKYYKIFSYRKIISNQFDFAKMTSIFQGLVKEKKEERKSTKEIRKKVAEKERLNQSEILKKSSEIIANEFFTNRKVALLDFKRLLAVSKKSIEGKTKGCDFYPCEVKK